MNALRYALLFRLKLTVNYPVARLYGMHAYGWTSAALSNRRKRENNACCYHFQRGNPRADKSVALTPRAGERVPRGSRVISRSDSSRALIIQTPRRRRNTEERRRFLEWLRYRWQFSFENGARLHGTRSNRASCVHTLPIRFQLCIYVYRKREEEREEERERERERERGREREKERESRARATHFEVTPIESLDSATLNWNYHR